MQKGLKKIGVTLVAVGVCLALLLTAAIPVCEAKPAEENEVKIGLIGAFTGALASIAVPVHEGTIDYIRYLNEQGGINGIKVKLEWADYGSAAPRTIPIHKRMAAAGIVLEIYIEEGAARATLPRMIRDEIPGLYIAGSVSPLLETEPLWVIGSGTEAENIFSCAVECLMKPNWTEERPLRIGYFHADQPLLNEAWNNIGPYLKEIGVEPVGDEKTHIVGVIDTSTEWLRLAGKKPDWVIVSQYGGTLVVVAKDAARLEIQRKGINLMADPISLEEKAIKIVGKAAEGWYRMCYEPTPVTYPPAAYPMMGTVLEVAKRYRGFEPEDVGIAYIRGWISGAVAVEGVRLAIEEVGLENLTGRAVRDALLRIKDFDTGLSPIPIIVTKDKPYFNDFAYFVLIEGGKFVRITDFMEMSRIFYHVVIAGESHTKRF